MDEEHRDVLSVIPEEERARPNLDLDLDNLPVERTLESSVGRGKGRLPIHGPRA